MKRVRFLVDTAYQGPRKEGDVISVPDDFASRWVKNGIATYEQGDKQDNEEPVAEDPIPVNEEEPVQVPEEELTSADEKVNYDEMNAKELYTLCKEKGIEVEAKKSREYYLEKLA